MNTKHYYCIVASANNQIIAVTSRQKESEDSNLGVFHKLLNVDLNEHVSRKINHEIYVDSETICDLVNYMKEKHNDMKELEFLYNCLVFFKENKSVSLIKFTFYND